MLNKQTLNMLLDHAQKRSDVSAKILGELTSHHQAAEQKLNLLLGYRRSYQEQFQEVSKNGIDHVEWLNFIAFIKKLDAAIAEQQQSVSVAQNNRAAGGKDFQSCQFKLKSYDTLSKRHQQTEMQQQVKFEQKEQDEHVCKPNNFL